MRSLQCDSHVLISGQVLWVKTPANIDRKPYPQKVGKNSRSSLIVIRSQWNLINSPQTDQPFRQCANHLRATRGQLKEYVCNSQKLIHLQHVTVHEIVEVVDIDRSKQKAIHIVRQFTSKSPHQITWSICWANHLKIRFEDLEEISEKMEDFFRFSEILFLTNILYGHDDLTKRR